jgi:triacylglycerol lipase
MNRILAPLTLAVASLLASGLAAATTASYTLCTTSGCGKVGGTATVKANYAQTKYPIVFAHGMAGFSQIGPIDYWYGIPVDLTANGAKVFVTQVASFNSSEVRGEQLLAQVKIVLAITGAAKVNLIGHSHGSQSIRYVAGVLPAKVASATAVGGPNTGSPVADLIQGVTTIPGVGTVAASTISSLVNTFFKFIDLTSGKAYEQDALAGLKSLTTAGAAAFNKTYPAGMPASSNACGQGASTVKGVNYYSWGGTGHLTSYIDPTDYLLAATSFAFGGKGNDGLVGQCSSHLGVVIRDNYNMNHLDEVNQIIGLVSIFESSPVTVFRQQANRLKLAGF